MEEHIIVLLKENSSISHATSIFAINCSIILGFLLCLVCCCGKMFGKSKKNNMDTEESRFKIIEYKKINALDSALFELTFAETMSVPKAPNQVVETSVHNESIGESKDEEKGTDAHFVKMETPPRQIKKPFLGCIFRPILVCMVKMCLLPFKCCCKRFNKKHEFDSINMDNKISSRPEEQKKKYILYRFNNLNDNVRKKIDIGMISSSGKDTDPFINLEAFVNIVLKTCDPKNIEILLHISSPGGVAYKFEKLYSSVKRLSGAGYKITALIDDICASGGYMLACACDKIVCSKYSKIGSVGVIAGTCNYYELTKKIGFEVKTFKTGKYKNSFPTGEPYSEEDVERMNEMMFETLGVFGDIVKSARHLDDEKMHDVLSARVWYGMNAIEKGLVDEISLSEEYLQKLSESGSIYIVVPKEAKDKSSLLTTILNSSYINDFVSLFAKQNVCINGFDKVKLE